MEKTKTTTKTQCQKLVRQDVQQLVTDTIIQQLEEGTIPWQKPWTGGNPIPFSLPKNCVTDKGYRGVNILLLWSASIKHNYQSSEWASFKQWGEKNEMIRKGEKGNFIVYYDTFDREVDGEIQKIPYLKTYYVFNKCQLASYVPEENIQPDHVPCLIEKIDIVDQFLENTKAAILPHDGGACYKPMEDKIYMPYMEQFANTATCTATEGFYSTLLHELTHWTGAKHRLDRTKSKKFGDDNYAVEELIAEFGAAFLCAGFGIATLEKGDHAGYIESWLKVLKENKQILFTAASEASKAIDYLYTLQI